jgi:hypothetical protein
MDNLLEGCINRHDEVLLKSWCGDYGPMVQGDKESAQDG